MPEPSRLDLDAYILAQCDTFLKAELDKYPRSWALASLALLDLGGPLQRRISELHPNHSQDIRHLPLPLLQPYDLDNSNLPVKASCRSFSSYLHSLLGDAQRGGEYFLTGEVYNRVTVEYAKHVIGSRSILYDTLIIYEDLPRLLDEAALSRELLDCLPNLHSHLFPSMHEQFLAIESLIDNYLRVSFHVLHMSPMLTFQTRRITDPDWVARLSALDIVQKGNEPDMASTTNLNYDDVTT